MSRDEATTTRPRAIALELLQQVDLEVYLFNTGSVGGDEQAETSKRVNIQHSAAVQGEIVNGSIAWQLDPDFGYLVPTTIPGSKTTSCDSPDAGTSVKGVVPSTSESLLNCSPNDASIWQHSATSMNESSIQPQPGPRDRTTLLMPSTK